MMGPERRGKQSLLPQTPAPVVVSALDPRVTRRGSFYFGFYRFYFWGFTNPSHARVRPEP